MHSIRLRLQAVSLFCAMTAVVFEIESCQASKPRVEPSIEITRAPSFGEGSPVVMSPISGRVKGAETGDRVVLFARSGVWWVQPMANEVFTQIESDSRWNSSTHLGSAYAALLVDSRYHPPITIGELPEKGGPVRAVVTVTDDALPRSLKALQFSGYTWEILDRPSNRGGTLNAYDPGNAWTDKLGYLHLQIRKLGQRWTSAEVKLSRSLGYGSYRFVVQDVDQLEPAAVFSMLTWDDAGPTREMDIEVSRWGEPAHKNAQFVIQPYVVPANSIRFNTLPGKLSFFLDWQPGRASFRTVRGAGTQLVANHVFTSGVPSLGNEKIHLVLYVFDNHRNPLRYGSEVVVEKFEFLP